MLHDRTAEQLAAARPAAGAADVRLRARRSPRALALGVLCVTLGGLGAGALYMSGNDQHSVVVMSRDVVRGQQIASEDLSVVSVPGDLRVDAVGADALTTLVGQTALSDLPAGAFPAARHIGAAAIPAGQSLVGLQLGPGRMPGTSLEPGAKVRLVSLVEGDKTALDAVVAAAPLITDDGTGFVVDVLVPGDVAEPVARLSAAGQLALIALGDA